MKNLKKALLVPTAALALTAAMPAEEAQAARIPIVYNSGDDLFVAGDGAIPEPFAKEPVLAGAQAGYRCDVFGLFGAYLTISNCEPVAFRGDTYWNPPELAQAIATAHPEASMQIPFWKKHGRIVVGVLGLGLLGFGAFAQLSRRKAQGATA